ncbi:MAG: hypothetical protein ACRD3W_16930, partial [Terriglobales bacterium]
MAIAIGLLSLFTAQPALAYTPKFPCVAVTNLGTQWPDNGHIFSCTQIPFSQDTIAQKIEQAAQGTP